MIPLLSGFAFADTCPESQTAEFVSWARPALFEWGEWSSSNGTLELLSPEPKGRWNIWIPRQDPNADAHHVLRLAVGKTPNTTLMARVTLEPHGRDEISGYGLSLEDNHLVLYRWDKGERRALMPSTPVEVPKEMDLRFVLSGDSLTGYACTTQSNDLLAKVPARTSIGLWGILQDPKQGVDTKSIQMHIGSTDQPSVIDGHDIFGTEVLVQLSAMDALPEKLQPFDLERPPYPGQWLLLPDRSLLDQLSSTGIQSCHRTDPVGPAQPIE